MHERPALIPSMPKAVVVFVGQIIPKPRKEQKTPEHASIKQDPLSEIDLVVIRRYQNV